ncbi:MAG: 30S ribosomal protein S1, partial [Deltaproteobacteria bacterium]|nr:30S ribosomal protein S1 [Deltaproteobacteria bacterium]
GRIPVSEFKDMKGELTVKENDKVYVYLEEWEDENGEIVLSKDKADQLRVWEEISKVLEKDGVIEGKVSALIKGGLSVDIGVQAFLPGSQVDLHPVRNLENLIGKTFKFKVLKFNRKRGNIVLSRRALLEKERETLRKETIKVLKEGEIVEGIIKNITDYGLFIDLGGIDGLLHITDMSWGRVTNPSELFKIGDTLKVKILNFDRENERVSLGYKQIRPDPWEKVDEKYPIGARVKGKIVNITNYGAFIELEEGIEGLIHISEMSWVKKVKHPSQIVSIGDMVEAMILDLDVPKKRISLSLKQLEPNPWFLMEEKYPPGTVIEGKIKNVTDFGIFIGFDEGIDGLVHISDISWTQKIKHPSELYTKGQEVRAVVLSIDKDNERFSLGIKQLEKDPWETISEHYEKGQHITGTVTNITSFGVFVEMGEGVEGLIHVSEFGDTKVEDYKSGNEISTVITNIDKRGRKISLSIKEIKELTEKKDVSEYIESQEQEPPSSFGEKLKERLEEQKEVDEEAKEESESTKVEEPLATEAVSEREEEEKKEEVDEGDKEENKIESVVSEAQGSEETGEELKEESESTKVEEPLAAEAVNESEEEEKKEEE